MCFYNKMARHYTFLFWKHYLEYEQAVRFLDARKMVEWLREFIPSIFFEQIENFSVDKWRRVQDLK